MPKTAIRSVVYSPEEVATLGQEYLGWRKDNKFLGVPFPIPRLSDRIYPMFPGEMMSIIARPGHCKTGLMMFWARKRAEALKGTKRVVVYATWEQSVEELHSFYVASQQRISITKMAKGDLKEEDWEKVQQASADRIAEPMFFIGHSMVRKSGRQAITTETLGNAIEDIQQEFDVDMVYADYLQRISPMGNQDNPAIAYSRTVDELKNLCLGLSVPMTVGVQASREVETLKLQIPEMHHAQWTSNIEQSSDRVLSAVRPRRYRKEGEMFGSKRVEGHNQLLIQCLKQKLGDSNFAEWIGFNPIYNTLDQREIQNGGVGE